MHIVRTLNQFFGCLSHEVFGLVVNFNLHKVHLQKWMQLFPFVKASQYHILICIEVYFRIEQKQTWVHFFYTKKSDHISREIFSFGRIIRIITNSYRLSINQPVQE
ncbi:hypothetical protein BpHYR1_039589 [Brachionus plicatilis]|uniref:Uncharacterized protein n=1 Tax=Brachionus plicatilis TaxID=10195 RepID=A0A3M7QN41_BRAPC|nr:hypothetical protein BpHYR1_039589 [Brachionus plicatilis]